MSKFTGKYLPRIFLKSLLLILTALCLSAPVARAEIKLSSWIMRDRAVVLDSLVLRKEVYLAFKTSLPLSKIKGGAAVGVFSFAGRELSRDTLYFFDEAAGTLGFGLPYEIPDGAYHLDIRILSKAGQELDHYTGELKRSELKPYFQREINYWDYTTPYAELECSGYGYITYHFDSPEALEPASLEFSARMTTDNGSSGRVRVSLNDREIGEFDLPEPRESKAPEVVTWTVGEPQALAGADLVKGVNRLTLAIAREFSPRGMGIRLSDKKNTADPALGEAVPLVLKVKSGAVEKIFRIPVWGTEGEHVKSSFDVPGPANFVERQSREEQKPLPLTPRDVRQGYVAFQKHYLRYVYPWTVPTDQERVDTLALQSGRNDFQPLTFSIYPLRELGDTRVTVEDFRASDGKGAISSTDVKFYIVKNLKIRGGGDRYHLAPRLLERTDHTAIPIGYTTRFWLTVHVDSTVPAGSYSSVIHVQPENEPALDLPVRLEVLPVRLEPVPGIAYSMFMSYEFFELENKDWNAAQKELIYQDGLATFRDYLDHGMSTVDVASPYYFQWNKDGAPRMEHFKAMVRGAKEAGFTRPIYWYFAQYVQAAKHQHPGNILLYDPQVHPKRAKFLVETALKLNKEMGGLPLEFMPIDEPRIALRQKITLELFKAVKEVKGARIMCSTDIGGKLLDIENNNSGSGKKLKPGEKKRHSEREVWEYFNEAVDAPNPGYSRYIYGYYTWRQDLDGMNSWGPGTTENSRGNPYEDLDHIYTDYMLFYPAVGGPNPSVNWEALREGIDDVRYVYQLEKLIREKGQKYPHETAEADKFLDDLRAKCDIEENTLMNDFGSWTPEAFDQARQQVIGWIGRLGEL